MKTKMGEQIRTILIVDDQSINREILANVLGDEYALMQAESGEEALALLTQRPDQVDLILLDLVMPGMSGYDMIKKLRDVPILQEIPVMVVTALDDVDDEVQALDLGAVDLITKPFDARIVRQRIRNVLDRRCYCQVMHENDVLREQTQAQVQLHAIMDNMMGGIMLLEMSESVRAIYINNGFFDMPLHDRARLAEYEEDILAHIHPEDKNALLTNAREATRSHRPFTADYRTVYGDAVQWMHVQAVEIPYPESEFPVLLAIITDITELKSAELSLNETSSRLTALMENVPGGIAVVEVLPERYRVEYANPGFFKLSGTPEVQAREELDNFDCTKLVFEEDLSYLRESTRQAISHGKISNCAFRITCRNGSLLWLRLSASRLDDSPAGNPMFYILLMDITKIKQQEEVAHRTTSELQFRAVHDMLTGLLNREGFCYATANLLKVNPDEKYAMVLWNIERFKVINDLFGKQTGDAILNIMAARFVIGVSEIGTCARLEADRFVVCIPREYLDPERLIRVMENSLKELELDYKIVLNMGIYEIDDVTIPVERMCDRANLALQTIKGSYVNRYAFYDDKLRRAMLAEQEIISEMNDALQQHQFLIYLQPVYSLAAGAPISAEALVRWKHPIKGIISPGVFIPLFEKNGFIAELDYYVWEEACRYLKHRKELGMPELPISVNVSRRSLYSDNLCAEIVALVRKYGIEPALLKLEITESAYTDNPDQLLKTMTTLQTYGFAVLMDDFGSGYSSLNTLKDIPVDILKIDMKFMEDFETSDRAGNILTSVVRMAKWLNTSVIAEGVETQPQVDFLRSIGCDRIQGYFFSRPLPIPDFERLCEEGCQAVTHQPAPVTELNMADFDALFNSNEMMHRLFNSVIGAIGIYELVDDRLEVLRVNDGYYSMFGYTPHTFHSDSPDLFQHVHPDDRGRVCDACRQAATEHDAREVVFRRIRMDDTQLYIHAKVRYLGGTTEQPLICLAFNDISAFKRAEVELSEHQQTLQNQSEFMNSLYHAVLCGIAEFTADEMPRILGCNRYCCEMFGFPSSEVICQEVRRGRTTFIGETEYQTFLLAAAKCRKTHESVDCELRLRRRGGEPIRVHGKLGMVRNPDGILILQVILLDITEQRRVDDTRKLQQFARVLNTVFDEVLTLDLRSRMLTRIAARDGKEVGVQQTIAEFSQSEGNQIIHADDIVPMQQFLESGLREGVQRKGMATLRLRVCKAGVGAYRPLAITCIPLEGAVYLCCFKWLDLSET